MDKNVFKLNQEQKRYVVNLLLERYAFLDYRLNTRRIRHIGWRRRYLTEMTSLQALIHEFTVDDFAITNKE